MISESDAQKVHDAYQALYDSLDDAYWVSTNETRQQIFDAKDAVSLILDKLNAEDLASRTGAFEELVAVLADTNKMLEKVRDDVASLLRGVAAATQVATGVDEVVKVVSQVVK
jgi:ABC-type transporter Mla subunit MlaD